MDKKEIKGELALQKENIPIKKDEFSAKAFGAIYDEWAVRIYKYVYSRVQNALEAEDITSQVFLVAFQALPRYKHRGYFSAWLFGIARNKLKEYYRKGHQNEDSIEFLSAKHRGQNDFAQAETARDEIDILLDLIRALPEADQELLQLRYVAGLKFDEIGRVVKRSKGSVKKKIYRIQYKLGQKMEDKNA